MSVHPDWGSDDSLTSLKTVLKWEIQHLLQRLAEVGEEALLVTVSVRDGGTTEMGSPRGQVFLSMSDLQNIKAQFQSYCQGFLENVEDQVEVYRDLSSGQLTLGPRSSIDTGGRRKRPKKTYLQQPKVPRVDTDQFPTVKAEVSSDDNSGNGLDHETPREEHSPQYTADTNSCQVRSRRKRTPKKVSTKINTSDNDNEDSSLVLSENSDQTGENFDNQSENLEMTGSMFEDFYVKKSQSLDQICGNQCENLELTSHSEDFCLTTTPPSQGDGDSLKEEPFDIQRTSLQPEAESHELAVLLRKTKDTVSKKMKNNARKSMKPNSTSCYETDTKCSHFTDNSLPVFPDSGTKTSLYANSVSAGNSVGNDDACFPVTMCGEDGNMRVVFCKTAGSPNSPVLKNENSLLQQRLLKSADNSPKSDRQALDNSSLYTPPRKRGFKPIPHDENPAETALLDASKLCIGRYQCPMCSQTTRDRHDLKRHLRTHTKEKPYQCSLCGKRFTRKWDLENHYSRHNRADQDEITARNIRQSSKANDSSNTEVLTYEKLVSKLLLEKNITIKGSDETETAEGDIGVNEGNIAQGDNGSIEGDTVEGNSNVLLGNRGVFDNNSQERIVQGIKTEKQDWNDGASMNNQNNTENIAADIDRESRQISLKQDDSESGTQETELDNLVVKFMNDTISSLGSEQDDSSDKQEIKIKTEPENETNI